MFEVKREISLNTRLSHSGAALISIRISHSVGRASPTNLVEA